MSRPPHTPLTDQPRTYSAPNTTSYDSPTVPSTLSPQSPSGSLPGMALLGSQVLSRPEPAARLHFPPPVHMSSSTSNPHGRYGSEYDRVMQPEQYQLNRMIATPPGMHGDPIQGHKRAYRQRRKDPSCDACRERKVKCDATETSSCSECSSRSVKCQFTKETNRRMSSIKQVQDLEKQLLAAKQQVSKLQSLVKPDSIAVEDDEDEESIAPSPERPNKRRRVERDYNITAVRRNMLTYGGGIFRAPTDSRPRSNPRSPPVLLPVLPTRGLGLVLVKDYRGWLHQKFPFVDLDLVTWQFDEVYKSEGQQVPHNESAAVLFGVFACGALWNHVEEGHKYFSALKVLIDFWEATPTLQLIRAMLLSCIFLIETNCTSTAFNMMGHAVRAAQDLGLHHQGDSSPVEGGGLKRNLWLALFCLERTLAYELGRPSMISDEDFVPPLDPELSLGKSQEVSRLARIVQVVQAANHLRKAFKNHTISPGIAQAVDSDIHRCMSTLPTRQQLMSNERLVPGETHAITYLQDIRLLLHRHNLNPSCSREARLSGIQECLSVAQNTARTLSRVVVPSSQIVNEDSSKAKSSTKPERWEEDMRLSSSTFMCLHVWRCMLFLTACSDYEGALLCAMACKAIGKVRPINSAGGRYFEFFLNFCIDRRRQKSLPLEEDEELIAYLSADMQGNLDQAWVWQDDDDDDGVDGTSAVPIETLIDMQDQAEWNNWERIIEELRRLLEEQKPRPEPQKPKTNGATSGSQAAPRLEPTVSPIQQISPSNRMSIADLI